MSRDPLPVVVTTAVGDTVAMFFRGSDGALTQTGQFASVGRTVDAATLAALTADLADTFGWSETRAVTNGHGKQPKALPAAPTHPAVTGKPPTPTSRAPKPKHSPNTRGTKGYVRKTPPGDFRRRPRRGRAAMAALDEATYTFLADRRGEWFTATEVLAGAAWPDDGYPAVTDAMVRGCLTRLGRRVTRQVVPTPGNMTDGHRWSVQ